MRNRTSACALSLFVMAVPAMAQTPPAPSADTQLVAPPAWAFNDLACAPALATEKRDKERTDASRRRRAGPRDSRTARSRRYARHQRRLECGLQPGQRFFVRRLIPAVTTTGPTPRATIHTAGWVQILGVDTMVSTATVLHACDGILFDDYLEPLRGADDCGAAASRLDAPVRQHGAHRDRHRRASYRGARQCDDDRSRQQCRRRARPALHRVQRQARSAHRDGGPIAGVRRHGGQCAARRSR